MPETAKVTLVFTSQEAKSQFIGGLLDGWGEGGQFQVDWDCGESNEDGPCEVPATEADEIRVTVYGEEC